MINTDYTFFRELFKQDTLTVARELIGVRLGINGPDGPVSGVINETEAYTQDDPACHAFGGKQTPRNKIMFGPAGYVYIYFIYGMYYCLNIVTESEGRGCAVLIRSVIPDEGSLDVVTRNRNREGSRSLSGLADGPAKLVMALGISPELNGCDVFDGVCPLFLERQTEVSLECTTSVRVGISKGVDLEWRFLGGRRGR